ncbi:hypothetical protein [Gordonia malaquae]|uniref:hypothetical protein n=1 Tax=Gordonia malaquae TaxID=410332 RepID=UPI003018D876
MTQRSDGYHVTYGGESLNSFDVDGSTSEPAREAATYATEAEVRAGVELWEDGERVATWHHDEIETDSHGPYLPSRA